MRSLQQLNSKLGPFHTQSPNQGLDKGSCLFFFFLTLYTFDTVSFGFNIAVMQAVMHLRTIHDITTYCHRHIGAPLLPIIVTDCFSCAPHETAALFVLLTGELTWVLRIHSIYSGTN